MSDLPPGGSSRGGVVEGQPGANSLPSGAAGALTSEIFGGAFVEPEVARLLSDEALVQGLLRFEGALAQVQGEASVIPATSAARIAEVCAQGPVTMRELAEGVQRDGMPMIALVAALREAVGPLDAQYVHFGATSQDALDTALVLQLRPAVQHIATQLDAVAQQLSALCQRHRGTVLAARTHGQQAVPTSFGLKVAGWLSPLLRHLERLALVEKNLWQLQLAGAAGTLHSLGNSGQSIRQQLAKRLQLSLGEMAWHTQRDPLVELGHWMCLVCGSLGKMAQDVLLLAQTEVGEVLEAPAGTRGGSSCMPQKNNPMRCEQILAAARSAVGHQSVLYGAQIAEHERATHGWQIEWLNLTPIVSLTAGALRNAASILADLQVVPDRMRDNLSVHHDLALGEHWTLALSKFIPRPEAQNMVKSAVACALQQRQPLGQALQQQLTQHVATGGGGAADFARALEGIDWGALADPQTALGLAGPFVDAVLKRAGEVLSSPR